MRKTTDKTSGKTVLVLKVKQNRHEFVLPPLAKTINVFLFNRRIVFMDSSVGPVFEKGHHHGYDNASEAVAELANLTGSPSLIVRLFQAALDGRKITSEKVGSGYSSRPSLRLERVGRRVEFEAPCGATGYLTVGEVEKLIEAIPTL